MDSDKDILMKRLIATYLDDNDITKLALINKLNEIKNNGDLSNDKTF